MDIRFQLPLYIPMNGAAGSYGNHVETLSNCQTLFPKWLYHFKFPPGVREDPDFSTASPMSFTVCLFDSGLPSGCEAIAHGTFKLHFPEG